MRHQSIDSTNHVTKSFSQTKPKPANSPFITAQLVGAGVQKLNTSALRTASSASSGVTTSNASTGTGGSSIIVQQQQSQNPQQSGGHQSQQATITVSSTGGGNQGNQAIQLVGTIQQGGRNIQVMGTKQLTGNRQIITQRQIGGSTLKIAAANPINGKYLAKINLYLNYTGNARCNIYYV